MYFLRCRSWNKDRNPSSVFAMWSQLTDVGKTGCEIGKGKKSIKGTLSGICHSEQLEMNPVEDLWEMAWNTYLRVFTPEWLRKFSYLYSNRHYSNHWLKNALRDCSNSGTSREDFWGFWTILSQRGAKFIYEVSHIFYSKDF